MRHTSLGHIALQTQRQVVDDAIAVLHHRCTDLHVATAYLNKLQGVAPRLDASDTAQLDVLALPVPHDWVLSHFEDKAQGNGLDGATR